MDDPTSAPSDLDLLAAVRDGDKDALDTLVTRYESRVLRFGMTMCHDVEDARDVLQDTFMAMVRSLDGFRADASLSTWLYAIAHHACLKKRRRSQFAPRRVSSLEALAPHERERMAAPGPDPEEAAAVGERQVKLRAAIRALDPPRRAVLLLRDIEGLTATETARALGLSVAAVKSRLHRARAAVRTAFVTAGVASPARAGCPDIAANFSRHLEGDLSAAACAALEAHLANCPSCQASCDALKEALGACRGAALPRVPATTQRQVREAVDACLVTAAPPAR